MAKITYVQPDGQAETFDVPLGYSVKDGASQNGVPGIIAECGGACACATCKVFVEPAWAERMAKPGPLEQSMIDEDEAEKEHLRLSCQIPVTEALDGLVVRIPTKQS
jgi:ferredoxin, 2Fe-2S